mmetsp:Transcript_3807/g.10256  ORF Transcript_3807/g.10256 Transcript_3807/m.10256 type:complete len:134 (+) Transcript_3807:2-403(+)
MTGKSGNLRANMFIFKVATPINSAKFPYVVMEEEGGIGEYNRANRSMNHFVENAAGVMLAVLLAGFVFPTPTAVLVVLFSIGRVLHQTGYAAGGYGKHAPGFMLSTITQMALIGLVFVAMVSKGTPEVIGWSD